MTQEINRREILKAAGLTAAGLGLAACGATGGDGFGSLGNQMVPEGRPYKLFETPKGVNLPPDLLTKIAEAEAAGKIPSHHGTIAWSLISPKILERLGYGSSVVEAADGIKSFRMLMESEKYSFFVFNRHKLNSPDGYLNPKGDTGSLWVATQRPNNGLFKGAGYLMANDYTYRMTQTRTFSPEISQQVSARLKAQVSELSVLVASGQATTEQTVLYNRSLFELEFNQQRLDLYAKIQQNLTPSEREIVNKAINTPVILQFDLDDVQYSKNPNQISGTVRQGELSYKDMKAIYVPGTMDPKVMAFIKELYPDTPIIIDKYMLPDGFIQRLPPDVYKAMFQGAQAFNKGIQWLPMIGLVSYAITPMGIATAELSEASASYEEQVAGGKTNMTFTEWKAFNSDIPGKLHGIQDGLGNSLYEPVIDIWERVEEPNGWEGSNIQKGIPTELELVVPAGTDVVTQVAVGDTTVLGKMTAHGVGEISEDVELGSIQITYAGKKDGMPNLKIDPLNGSQIGYVYDET